jgi:hypothetical protein
VILAGLFTPGEMLKHVISLRAGRGGCGRYRRKQGERRKSILKKTWQMWYGKGKRKRAKGAY